MIDREIDGEENQGLCGDRIDDRLVDICSMRRMGELADNDDTEGLLGITFGSCVD